MTVNKEKIMDNQFTWIPFYKELSNVILSYRADRKRLIKNLEEVFSCCSRQRDKYSYEFGATLEAIPN